MPRDDELTPPRNSVHALLERHATNAGASPYLLSTRDKRQLSYSELRAQVAAWREVLHSRNIPTGARIGLMIADPMDFATAFIAVLCNGSWAAPLDPSIDVTNHDLFERRTQNLHLDVMVSERRAPLGEHLPWIVVPDDRDQRASTSPMVKSPSSGGLILSSSGTTGTPKVIALTEAQLMYAATLIAQHNRLSPEERGFNPLPLWHVNAEVVGLLATLVAGASLVLDDRFHRTDFWRLIDEHEVTWINAVPAIISRIATLDDGETVPSRVRFVRSASAPLSPALSATFEANTGVAIVESYGMTEAASQICVNPLDGPRKVGSVGPPVGVSLRITPLEDSASSGIVGDSPLTTVGHVEIRGPSVITHYDAQGYEDRFDEDGWLKTGDLGYLDDDGYLFLVGRNDDVINRGGEKIFPREIEDLVLGTSGVVAAAVVGVPDDVFGQVPVLFVQFEVSPLDVDERVNHLATVLSETFTRARRPIRIVVLESFPSHATGKVQRKALANYTDSVLLERDLV
jgi:acyl-CoA synthetase (AMP-forming)/AMP-acid ligase II